MHVPRLGALITAAGASTRMGLPKALVPWAGAPLLVHQVRVLGSVGHKIEVVAVVGCHEPLIRADHAARPELAELVLVDNPRWEEGRSTSLEVGARALRGCDAALVVAVDQPLEAEVVKALLAALTPRGDEADVVAPRFEGRRGHPLLVSAAVLAELEQASRHVMGLRDIVRAARVREVDVASASIHLDLNTPEDLARAHR